MINLDIQHASAEGSYTPDDDDFRRWADHCLNTLRPEKDTDVSIRLVTSDEITQLNSDYRDKPKATNVLSFPAEFPEEMNIPLIGDIVICAEVVNREAEEQHKTQNAHWAHMTLHGILHLLGYDHIDDDEAQEMESLETQLLQELGFPAPYDTQAHSEDNKKAS